MCKREEERLFSKNGRRWEDNIKIGLKQIVFFLGVSRTFIVQVRNYKLLKNDFDSGKSELVGQSVQQPILHLMRWSLPPIADS